LIFHCLSRLSALCLSWEVSNTGWAFHQIEKSFFPLEILTYDEIAAGIYGDIRLQLAKRGEPIGPLDLMIAAHALSRNLVLISNNEKEFNRVKDLKVENWVK
jgi:tRNA(fMet)-specific endonuclease VapC